MEQAKIEQLAFLYLCSEHDKRLLLKKGKMPLADFDRLTYLIYHLGFKEYHIKVWMEFAGDFKKEWDCLEALQETGGCAVSIENTESESRLHEMWILDFCKNASEEKQRMDSEIESNNINDKYTLVHFCGIIIKIELNLVNPCL